MPTYIGLFIAILAVSWASIFIRWCEDTPALIISFYRMLWTFLLFTIFFIRRPKQRRTGIAASLIRHDRLLIVASGFLLALHFATWIASLQLTTIAHSLILLSTHPVFALILSPLLLKERGGWQALVAVMLTFIGIVIIGGQDFGFKPQNFLGDVLALNSALFLTLYLFIARFMREKIDLVPYLMMVYGVAALVLLVINISVGYPLVDYSYKIHFLMVLLALIPTGIGHSLFNWAARRIKAYKVNFAFLGEPVLASFMAYLFFREVPYGWFYIGAAFLISGIALALSERRA